MRSLLPDEWIVRPVAKDYGVDYEVELVDQTIVTGKRIWIQLKAVKRTQIKTHEELYVTADSFTTLRTHKLDYVPFRLSVKQIQYAFACPFPLLLFVADLNDGEIYWLPIRDDAKTTFPLAAELHTRSRIVRIPHRNRLTVERANDYRGLRWYALEPARMYVFADLHRYYDRFRRAERLSARGIGGGRITKRRKDKLIWNVIGAKVSLDHALQKESVFGKDGLVNPQVCIKLANGARAARQALYALQQRKYSIAYMRGLFNRITSAMNLLSNVVSEYEFLCLKFLFSGLSSPMTLDAGKKNMWKEF